jgi:Yip1-like protein
MIKAIWLILDSGGAWDRIVTAQRNFFWILFINLLPLLLLGSAAEGYGLVHWGRPQGELGYPKNFPVSAVVKFESAQLVLFLVVVFIGALFARNLANTFRSRPVSFLPAFTAIAYGLGPFLLLRVLNIFPVSPWLSWAVGIALSAMILYQGVPRVMEPDPPNAFGLYLTSTLLLVIATGLLCFISSWYLRGKITFLQNFLRG